MKMCKCDSLTPFLSLEAPFALLLTVVLVSIMGCEPHDIQQHSDSLITVDGMVSGDDEAEAHQDRLTNSDTVVTQQVVIEASDRTVRNIIRPDESSQIINSLTSVSANGEFTGVSVWFKETENARIGYVQVLNKNNELIAEVRTWSLMEIVISDNGSFVLMGGPQLRPFTTDIVFYNRFGERIKSINGEFGRQRHAMFIDGGKKFVLFAERLHPWEGYLACYDEEFDEVWHRGFPNLTEWYGVASLGYNSDEKMIIVEVCKGEHLEEEIIRYRYSVDLMGNIIEEQRIQK